MSHRFATADSDVQLCLRSPHIMGAVERFFEDIWRVWKHDFHPVRDDLPDPPFFKHGLKIRLTLQFLNVYYLLLTLDQLELYITAEVCGSAEGNSMAAADR